jgi:hypothetical protein
VTQGQRHAIAFTEARAEALPARPGILTFASSLAADEAEVQVHTREAKSKLDNTVEAHTLRDVIRPAYKTPRTRRGQLVHERSSMLWASRSTAGEGLDAARSHQYLLSEGSVERTRGYYVEPAEVSDLVSFGEVPARYWPRVRESRARICRGKLVVGKSQDIDGDRRVVTPAMSVVSGFGVFGRWEGLGAVGCLRRLRGG